MSSGSRHIPFEQLADFADGRLGAGDRARVEAHLAGCARCAAEAGALGKLIGLMRATAVADAPAHLVARAVRLFAPRAVGPAPGLRQRILATLRFDSGPSSQLSPAFGVRSAATAPRQLLFSAGEHEVDLRLAPAGDRWTIAGQVLGPGGTGQVVLQGPATGETTAFNEDGEFALAPVPAGTYTLRLLLGDVEVECPPMKVGA